MESIIRSIAGILRKSGVPVSAPEILDCIRAMEYVRAQDRQASSESGEPERISTIVIVNACLVKAQWGEKYVERLLELYFEAGEASVTDAEEGKSEMIFCSSGMGPGKGERDSQAAAELLQKNNPRRVKFKEAKKDMLPFMAVEVEKLAKKLAVKKGRRKKPASKGEIDLRRTMVRARSTGGVPLFLLKRDKKPVKPDLWLLCDLSNSVKAFSYFMLLFVYTLQKRYSNINSFIFIDRLLDVSDYLKGTGWEKVLDSIGDVYGYDISGYSHYGNVLSQFANSHLPRLSGNTTVIILGDARNNWNKTDGREVLDEIRKKAAALYWLNPMDRAAWDKEDCVMQAYIDKCTGAFQCSDIEQLERVVGLIM